MRWVWFGWVSCVMLHHDNEPEKLEPIPIQFPGEWVIRVRFDQLDPLCKHGAWVRVGARPCNAKPGLCDMGRPEAEASSRKTRGSFSDSIKGEGAGVSFILGRGSRLYQRLYRRSIFSSGSSHSSWRPSCRKSRISKTRFSCLLSLVTHLFSSSFGSHCRVDNPFFCRLKISFRCWMFWSCFSRRLPCFT